MSSTISTSMCGEMFSSTTTVSMSCEVVLSLVQAHYEQVIAATTQKTQLDPKSFCCPCACQTLNLNPKTFLARRSGSWFGRWPKLWGCKLRFSRLRLFFLGVWGLVGSARKHLVS